MFSLKFRSELLQIYFCTSSFSSTSLARKKNCLLFQLFWAIQIMCTEHVSPPRFQGTVNLAGLMETQSRHSVWLSRSQQQEKGTCWDVESNESLYRGEMGFHKNGALCLSDRWDSLKICNTRRPVLNDFKCYISIQYLAKHIPHVTSNNWYRTARIPN